MALVVLVQAASFAKQLDASVPEHLRKYHRCVAADADGWRPAPQVTDEPSFCNSIATFGIKVCPIGVCSLAVVSAGTALVVGISVASAGDVLVVISTGASLAVVAAGTALVVGIGVVSTTCDSSPLVVTLHCSSVFTDHSFQGHSAASGTTGNSMVNLSITSAPFSASQASRHAWPVPFLASSAASTSKTVRRRHLIFSTATA
mmetsp:Transcript_43945/g.110363  ORF Transcript_43945/g.110363 Transcript_43945/m.110363 type:complete len:203 (-) Transcript_43945:1048-1656(-)